MTFTEKWLTARRTIQVGRRSVKRYHIAAEPVIEGAVQRAAREFLPRLLPAPDDETPPASFVILHRARGGAAYLNAYSWVWGNVIECRVAVAGVPFLGCPDTDPCHFTELARPWIGCVWELAPLGHERAAWIRHVLAPGQPDLPGYLADVLPAGTTEPATAAGLAAAGTGVL